jgi:IS30 family transposase
MHTNQPPTIIAEIVGVDRSTIYRELKRNTGQRGYRPKQAHEKALARRQGKSKERIRPETWALVEEKLRLDWSPEQIACWLKKHGDETISHEWIYQYVYADKRAGDDLHAHLRRQKPYRKRTGSYDRRGKIPHATSIEERPEIVEWRIRLGDWEVDLIVGKGHQGVVVTLTERKSRFTLLRRVGSKQAELVAQAIIELLKWVKHLKTITADNGKEFANHLQISHHLGVDIFFAHPYASWERGTNENTNGLIRQYLPKSRNLTTLTAQEEFMIMDRLNLRPRKCLDFRTPYEVFFGHDTVAFTT